MTTSVLVWGLGRGEWLTLIVAVLIMVLSAVAKLLMGTKPQAPQRPAVAPPRRPKEEALDDEIGDFLRRAAQRRGPPARAAVAAPAPRQPQRGERAIAAQVIEDQPAEQPVGARVGKHVQQYLSTTEFEQRTTELGEEVAHADDEMGEHLREVFDHEVGRLAAKPGEAGAAPGVEESALSAADRLVALSAGSTAAGLTVVLSDFDSIRQAIVLSEILQRPEHRWEQGSRSDG